MSSLMGVALKDNVVRDLAAVINRYSLERPSNTPDYILAEYLYGCLEEFTDAVKLREDWYTQKSAIRRDWP